MINKDNQISKLQPLTDRINEVELKYGKNLSNDLINRLELVLEQFFEDFKLTSKKNFSLYWEEESKLKSRFNKTKLKNKDHIDAAKKNIPKFIEEFENKNKK